MNLAAYFDGLSGRRICILGYGREGMSTHRLLHKLAPEAEIAIADERSDHQPLYPVREYISGPDYLQAAHKYDLVIKSPGIPLRNLPELPATVELSSQTEIFLRIFTGTVIGITGTYGKSTTSTLIFHLLKQSGADVNLLGNIGIPPLDALENAGADSIAVFEMSSHQLQHGEVSPDIALILNLHAEHLDYYGTMEAYRQAKQRIAKFPRCKALIHALEMPDAASWAAANVKKINFSSSSLQADFCVRDGSAFLNGRPWFELPHERVLSGAHNDANLAAALAACREVAADPEALRAAIGSFSPLPHRMEFLGSHSGRKFYDDSASTAPEATLAAVNALAPLDTLIVGGLDRGIELEDFCRALGAQPIRALIGLPDTGHKIVEMLRKQDSTIQLYAAENLENAVSEAVFRTPAEGVCLFSPGAASYNAFANFVERGRAFRSCLEALASAK